MRIVDQYRNLLQEISVTKSNISLIKRDIKLLENEYCPRELKGVDYSFIQSDVRFSPKDVESVIEILERKKRLLNIYENELQLLSIDKKDIESTINSYGDVKSKMLMLKCQGLKNSEIADKMCYSKRQVERIISL